jgi:hypothetical protein
MSALFPRVRWQDHLDSLEWEQGDHILISAPTKSGKSTMVADLVEKRKHVAIMVSKLKDPTFETEFKNWKILREWPKKGPDLWDTRILLWPKAKKTLETTIEHQREIFGPALDQIALNGNRCVVIDESLMMNDPQFIGKGRVVGLMHYLGRSAGVSVVDLTQRPAWIPKVIYSSVSHAYIARTRDRLDMARLADLGGIDARVLALNLMALPSRHDFVYVNPQGDASPCIVNTRY